MQKFGEYEDACMKIRILSQKLFYPTANVQYVSGVSVIVRDVGLRWLLTVFSKGNPILMHKLTKRIFANCPIF